MNIFTNSDYKRIIAQLKKNAIQDSQFEKFQEPLNGSEYIPILQNGKNVLITWAQMASLMGGRVLVVPKPIINIDTTEGRAVIISQLANSTTYYTLDNSTPTINSILYTGPITLENDCVVKAVTIYDGMSSAVENAVYIRPIIVTDLTLNFDKTSNTDSIIVTINPNSDQFDTIYFKLSEEADYQALQLTEDSYQVTVQQGDQLFAMASHQGKEGVPVCMSHQWRKPYTQKVEGSDKLVSTLSYSIVPDTGGNVEPSYDITYSYKEYIVYFDDTTSPNEDSKPQSVKSSCQLTWSDTQGYIDSTTGELQNIPENTLLNDITCTTVTLQAFYTLSDESTISAETKTVEVKQSKYTAPKYYIGWNKTAADLKNMTFQDVTNVAQYQGNQTKTGLTQSVSLTTPNVFWIMYSKDYTIQTTLKQNGQTISPTFTENSVFDKTDNNNRQYSIKFVAISGDITLTDIIYNKTNT